MYETSDVPGPDEAAADEPGTATSFAFSAAAPEGPVPDEAAAGEPGTATSFAFSATAPEGPDEAAADG